jgi:uncharacterized protein
VRLDLDRTPGGRSSLAVQGQFDLGFGADGPWLVEIGGELCVDNLEGRCLLRGELTAEGPATCDRCLAGFTLRFPVAFELMVLRDAGHEDEDADSPIVHQRSGLVDLHENVREAVVLAVPQVRLCRPDCRGLCSRCGADRNAGDCQCRNDDVDPRWHDLPD